MKTIKLLFALTLSLIFYPASFANAQSPTAVTISSGQVTVTPARCNPDFCVPQVATLSGTLTFSINGSEILFSNISVKTSPDVGFRLPEDPNADSGGTVAYAKFNFDGTGLLVSGAVDSRAFDGPLIEYEFKAQVDTIVDEEFIQRGYFTVRQDYRKCVSPLCGGFFVKQVNRRYTRCADGSRQQECYVARLNWNELGFDPVAAVESTSFDALPLLLRGKILAENYDGFGNLGQFLLKSAYRAVGDKTEKSLYVGLQDNGIRCITTPCFSTDEFKLNSKRMRTISNIDLRNVNASQWDMDSAWMIIADGNVLLAAGENVQTKELTGRGLSFIAKQFFLPLAK